MEASQINRYRISFDLHTSADMSQIAPYALMQAIMRAFAEVDPAMQAENFTASPTGAVVNDTFDRADGGAGASWGIASRDWKL